MATTRTYTTRRLAIINALVDKFKSSINGTSGYLTELNENVFPRLKFWDEISDFPAVCINAGPETRIYQGGGFKERYLTVKFTCYVNNDDDPVEELETLLEDVETCIEDNASLEYIDKRGNTAQVTSLTIRSIDTDEGVMAPYGIGEMLVEVRY